MSTSDFPLIPASDDQQTAADDLAAAVQGALAVPDGIQPVASPAPAPMGISWQFDFDSGQMVRTGQSPTQTSDLDTLAQWCEMTIHTARFANAVFSDDFGMERPASVIGEVLDAEAIADWQRALIEALLVHDRITTVENVALSWDGSTGVLTVNSLDVITDEDETLNVSDVTLQAGGQ